MGCKRQLLHFPFVHVFTPAHCASQALPYVLPSHPHTGSYCMVHTQSRIGAPLHTVAFFVQEITIKRKNIAEMNMLFMLY